MACGLGMGGPLKKGLGDVPRGLEGTEKAPPPPPPTTTTPLPRHPPDSATRTGPSCNGGAEGGWPSSDWLPYCTNWPLLCRWLIVVNNEKDY